MKKLGTRAISSSLLALMEAWKISGKKQYTWKSNRTQFWLGLVIVILLGVIYLSHGSQAAEVTKLKTELKAAKSQLESIELTNAKLTMTKDHYFNIKQGLMVTTKEQDAQLKLLGDEITKLRSEMKSLELEKKNLENLLVGVTENNKELRTQLSEMVDTVQRSKQARAVRVKQLREKFNQLSQ